MRTLLSSPISSSSLSSSSQFHHRFYCFFSSIFSTINCNHFSSSSSSSSSSISKQPNPIFIDYLINTLGFSKTQSDSISKCFRSLEGPKKPNAVVEHLQESGFSETQIRKAILGAPEILSYKVDKTLKPKLSLFQNELGLTGSHLARFISSNPALLKTSLEQRLIPNVNILKKFVPEIENKENKERGKFIPRQRCSWFFGMNPKTLLSNISFLQSCGIVGDQLSFLLKRQLPLFSRSESVLRGVVLKAEEMGFSCNSRMLVYAVSFLGSSNSETLESKFKLLRSFGFSQEECLEMFRSIPALFWQSEKKLKLGIDFFDGAGFERKMLVRRPTCLTYSLEKRVIPRFKVYQILKSKQHLLNNKCPRFSSILDLTEKSFLEKFVFKFGDNAENLLAAYNSGNVLHSSTEQN